MWCDVVWCGRWYGGVVLYHYGMNRCYVCECVVMWVCGDVSVWWCECVMMWVCGDANTLLDGVFPRWCLSRHQSDVGALSHCWGVARREWHSAKDHLPQTRWDDSLYVRTSTKYTIRTYKHDCEKRTLMHEYSVCSNFTGCIGGLHSLATTAF